MDRVCVVDFDETLLTVDSTKYLVFRERLYLQLPILFWGLLFLLARAILPRSAQSGIRRRAKYLVLRALDKLGEEKIVEKYSKFFSKSLNFELLKKIRERYKEVYIISAAWQAIIQGALAYAGVLDFKIFGTRYTENFGDFSICWHEAKARQARELGLSGFDLYTDSYDDEPLMKLANKVTMV